MFTKVLSIASLSFIVGTNANVPKINWAMKRQGMSAASNLGALPVPSFGGGAAKKAKGLVIPMLPTLNA